eukprot:11227035-Lingulodinium_polyedra.AAC.1
MAKPQFVQLHVSRHPATNSWRMFASSTVRLCCRRPSGGVFFKLALIPSARTAYLAGTGDEANRARAC